MQVHNNLILLLQSSHWTCSLKIIHWVLRTSQKCWGKLEISARSNVNYQAFFTIGNQSEPAVPNECAINFLTKIKKCHDQGCRHNCYIKHCYIISDAQYELSHWVIDPQFVKVYLILAMVLIFMFYIFWTPIILFIRVVVFICRTLLSIYCLIREAFSWKFN